MRAKTQPLLYRGMGFASRADARRGSARCGAGYYCWACGKRAQPAVAKLRVQGDTESYGMYHKRCQPPRAV